MSDERTRRRYEVRRPGCTFWAAGRWTLATARRELRYANSHVCPGHVLYAVQADGERVEVPY